METNENTGDIEHLLRQCKVIDENCLYTAQAHFAMAIKARWQSRSLLVIPSVISAISGILVAVGLPSWLGAFAAASGLVTGIASILGVDRKAKSHEQVANDLTVLRHDARAMHEAYWREIPKEQLFYETRAIHSRYNSIIRTTEMTDEAAFQVGREKIKSGHFKPDFE